MRTRTLRVLKPVAVALAAVLLLGSAAAAADAGKKPKKFDSNITLKLTDPAAKVIVLQVAEGKVGSKVSRCERGRRVRVTFKPEMGEKQSFGEATTNNQGRYATEPEPATPGRYVAKVLREKKGGTVCKPAKSNPVEIGAVG